jgi:chaperonin cofactor prefoldin
MDTKHDQTGADQTKTGTEESEDLGAKLNEAIAERDNLKIKLRNLEKTAGEAKTLKSQYDTLLVERSTLETQFNEYKSTVRQQQIDTHVATALDAAGAKSVATVRKLIDLGQIKFGDDGQIVQTSVAEMINAVKTTDPYLFKEVEEDPKKGISSPTTTAQPPDIKRAADSLKLSSFELDLAAARKDAKDPFLAIQAVLKKHGKIT